MRSGVGCCCCVRQRPSGWRVRRSERALSGRGSANGPRLSHCNCFGFAFSSLPPLSRRCVFPCSRIFFFGPSKPLSLVMCRGFWQRVAAFRSPPGPLVWSAVATGCLLLLCESIRSVCCGSVSTATGRETQHGCAVTGGEGICQPCSQGDDHWHWYWPWLWRWESVGPADLGLTTER